MHEDCMKNIRRRGQGSLVQSSSASHGLEGSMTSADRERYESAYLPTAQQRPATPSNAQQCPAMPPKHQMTTYNRQCTWKLGQAIRCDDICTIFSTSRIICILYMYITCMQVFELRNALVNGFNCNNGFEKEFMSLWFALAICSSSILGTRTGRVKCTSSSSSKSNFTVHRVCRVK